MILSCCLSQEKTLQPYSASFSNVFLTLTESHKLLSSLCLLCLVPSFLISFQWRLLDTFARELTCLFPFWPAQALCPYFVIALNVIKENYLSKPLSHWTMRSLITFLFSLFLFSTVPAAFVAWIGILNLRLQLKPTVSSISLSRYK